MTFSVRPTETSSGAIKHSNLIVRGEAPMAHKTSPVRLTPTPDSRHFSSPSRESVVDAGRGLLSSQILQVGTQGSRFNSLQLH